MNVRMLAALARRAATPVVWFGGGMDLTPYYGFEDDAVHFHRACRDALAPFGADKHPRFKRWCDEYFFLKHRREARGIGGIFFDDFSEGGFANGFALIRAVGDAFVGAYLPIVQRRRELPYGERERDFQAYRRGRYVEFNLVFDRGTLFGLQSGGRVESILMSMPPVVTWRYDWQPAPGSPEARLYRDFLPPREWADLASPPAATRVAMKRVGVFGGSFDPVHNAHVALARLALEQLAARRGALDPGRPAVAEEPRASATAPTARRWCGWRSPASRASSSTAASCAGAASATRSTPCASSPPPSRAPSGC